MARASVTIAAVDRAWISQAEDESMNKIGLPILSRMLITSVLTAVAITQMPAQQAGPPQGGTPQGTPAGRGALPVGLDGVGSHVGKG